MKKTLVLVLCFAMLLTLAAGCTPAVTTTVATTKGPTTATTATPTTTLGPPVEISFVWPALSQPPADMKLVSDEINKITLAKANVTAAITCIANANYAQQIGLMITGGERMDVFLTMPGGPTHVATMVANNQLMDITTLAPANAQNMLDAVKAIGANYLDATTINGKLYSIPVMFDHITNVYMGIRKDVLTKNNLDLSKVKNVTDLEAIVKVLAEKETIPVLTAQGTDGFVLLYAPLRINFDNYAEAIYSENFGSATWLYGIIEGKGSKTVVNQYATAYYKKVVEMTHDWYTKGYIQKDSATQTEMSTVMIANNAALGTTSAGERDIQQSLSTRCKYDMAVLKIADAVVGTGSLQKFTYAIPVTSKQPAAALKYLALMYTNSDVLNLINMGIKDKHYIVNTDGTISLPPGVTPANATYYPNSTFLFPNQFLAKVWAPMPANMREVALAENKSSVASPLMGYSVNNSTFKNEITSLTNVILQYGPGLGSGALDPATELPKFLTALETAGYGKVVAEVQKQVDAFYAAKK
jgi:putative aldouronate transport system substrate-binding protein